jgi:hypothetical protein
VILKRKWNRIRRFILQPYYEVLYAYQRVTRGFSDRDMWSADMFMARQIAGMLRWHVSNGHGVPSFYARELCEDIEYMDVYRNEVYTRYALMFEEYGNNGHAVNDKWKSMFGGLTDAEVHEMMTWFGEHFTEFWD